MDEATRIKKLKAQEQAKTRRYYRPHKRPQPRRPAPSLIEQGGYMVLSGLGVAIAAAAIAIVIWIVLPLAMR